MPAGLAHRELRRARDLVGDRDLGRVSSRPCASVVPEVDDAARPATPIATSVRPRRHGRAERVRHDDGHRRCSSGADRVTDLRRRSDRCRREQRGGTGRRRWTSRFPRFHAHEAVLGLADDRSPRRRRTPARLPLDGTRRTSAIVGIERDDATFGLRHDLLGDDDTVSVDEGGAWRGGCRRDEVREVDHRAAHLGRSHRSARPDRGVDTSGASPRSRHSVERVTCECHGGRGVGHQGVGDHRTHSRRLHLGGPVRVTTSITRVPQKGV